MSCLVYIVLGIEPRPWSVWTGALQTEPSPPFICLLIYCIVVVVIIIIYLFETGSHFVRLAAFSSLYSLFEVGIIVTSIIIYLFDIASHFVALAGLELALRRDKTILMRR